MRVDGSMPSGAPKTSSTTVKESVSSNGQSSDFNKVLKSSVKSNNNFDKASKSSTEKNSTYSQNNIKSKNSDDTKNLVKNEVSKSKDISLDNGKKSNKIADKTKKNTDDNLALKNTSNVKDTKGTITWKSTDIGNLSGEIIFDEGVDTDTTFYTGYKLPVYGSETK